MENSDNEDDIGVALPDSVQFSHVECVAYTLQTSHQERAEGQYANVISQTRHGVDKNVLSDG